MATFGSRLQKHLFRIKWNSTKLFQTRPVDLRNVRYNHMFSHLSLKKEHQEQYKYEVSNDPKEWEFVERLMPLETVPIPRAKPNYPSGWRHPQNETFKHPYFVERSKNHMLPVYLKVYNINGRFTRVKNIYGDIWSLHNELKEYIEKEKGKQIASLVNEGANLIQFRGDFVYYCEQWLLSKGF